jgi:hypothetical protein
MSIASKEITVQQLKDWGITPELLNRIYRPANLYEMDRKPVLWLVMSGGKKRPLVRR